jgi:hypothetical protein
MKFNVDHGPQGHFHQKNFPLSLLEHLGFERAMAGGEYSMITRQEPGQESRGSPKSSARMLCKQMQTHITEKKLPFTVEFNVDQGPQDHSPRKIPSFIFGKSWIRTSHGRR